MNKITFTDLIDFSGYIVTKFDGTRPYLSTGALKETEIDQQAIEMVTFKSKPSRANINVSVGDILFAKMQNTVKVLQITDERSDLIVSTGFFVIRPKNGVACGFLLQYLLSDCFNKQKDKHCSGATQKAIGNSALAKIQIDLPSLPEQKRIASELDIVRNVLAKQKKQYKSFGDLIKSKFYEIFGDPVKNNKGWNAKKLSEVCEMLIAGGDKPQDFSNQLNGEYLYPVYSNGETNNGLLCYSKKYRICKQAITISARGTIGFCAIRSPFFTPVVRLITIVPDKEINIIFLKYLIDNTKLEKTGASQGQLTIPMIEKVKVYIPPLVLQQQFADFVTDVEQSKTKLKAEIIATETLYKALMQKYFGEEAA